MYAAPVFRYSPIRYAAVIAAGLVLFACALVWGAATDEPFAAAAGVVGLLFVGLFARAVRSKLRGGGPALTRDGDFLVGGELERPLPIAGTTFEIKSDHQGSWVIVLRSLDTTVRLTAGGWKLDGERVVTKAVAERALLELGLTHRN